MENALEIAVEQLKNGQTLALEYTLLLASFRIEEA